MKWEQLRLVGVQALEARTGASVRNPIVSSPAGYFVVRDVDATEPTANTLITEQKFSERIESGVLLPTEQIQAQRGYACFVASAAFQRALGSVGISLPMGPTSYAADTTIVYLDMGDVIRWRATSANSLLGQVEASLKNRTHRRLHGGFEDVLRQVRYITDRGTEARRRMYRALYQVIGTGRQPALADLATREFGSEFLKELTSSRTQRPPFVPVFDQRRATQSRTGLAPTFTVEAL